MTKHSATIVQGLLVILFILSSSSSANNTVDTANKVNISKTNSNGTLHKSSSPSPKFKTAAKSHNKNATFLSMMTDASSTGAKVIAEIVNHEISAASYTVHLLNCSDNIPVTRIELKPAIDKNLPPISNLSTEVSQVDLTAPLRSRTFMIDLDFKKTKQKLIGKAACLVTILNRFNEKLATKLVNFSPDDSCICAVKCACACFKDDAYLECTVISDEDAVAEWLNGKGRINVSKSSVPIPVPLLPPPSSAGKDKQKDEKTEFEILTDTFSSLDETYLKFLGLYLIILILLILLILGTCKGLWGICIFQVGRCGLAYFYDKPRTLTKYYERKYSKYNVQHDSEGYPLDPFTRARTVKRLNPVSAFLLNVVFFLCCPFFCFLWMKSCCCSDGKEDSPYDGKERELVLTPTISGNLRRRSLPRNTASKIKSPDISTSSSSKNVRKSSLDTSNPIPDDDEEDEEGMLPESRHSEPTITAAYAQVYTQKKDSTPILSPLPNSSTFLKQLNRQPETNPAEHDPHRNLKNEGGQWGSFQGQCCKGVYGSWHRAPALFTDVGMSRSAFEMSRRRTVNPVVDKMGFRVESNNF